jgi:GT2 family glycosyltransferase
MGNNLSSRTNFSMLVTLQDQRANLPVWVVIPNRDGLDHLHYSLPALSETTYKVSGVVLVDNVSSDGSVQYVKTEFPWVHVLENSVDRGFAGSANVAISFAMSHDASLVAVFSNDIIVRRDWLDWAVATMMVSEKIAVVGFKELPRSVDAGAMKASSIQSARIEATDSPSGALTVYRASALEQVGLFDEVCYMYGEETDLYRRMERAGFDLVSCDVPFWHFNEGFAKKLGGRRVWLAYRNAVRVAVRNEHLWGRLRAVVRLLHFGCNPFVSKEKGRAPAVKRLRGRNAFINIGLVIAACWWNALHSRYYPVGKSRGER